MDLKFDLEGAIDLSKALDEGLDYLGQDLADACVQAGDAAVAAMQASHPYQDRTYNLSGGMHCRMGRRTRLSAEAVVEFTAPYASYVNYGTSRSRPYPFIPTGEYAAESVLQVCVSDAVNHFCETIMSKIGG